MPRAKRLRKLLLCLLLAQLSLFVCYRLWGAVDDSYLDVLLIDDDDGDEWGVNRTILLWTSFFGRWEWDAACPRSNCRVTTDRGALSAAQAVVFHVRDVDPFRLPRRRWSGQRYVFYLLESPLYTVTDLRRFPRFFNWTLSYRLDSDIVVHTPLLLTTANNNKSQAEVRNASRKSGLAVALISHCWTFSRREKYVEQLQRYMAVDVYGDCGHQRRLSPCQRSQAATLHGCFSYLQAHYKFYLSFENSLCKDYVTEKFYNALRYDLLPVVLGGANHAAAAPPHSYVDASHFASPKHLAEYLLRLAADDQLYAEYFRWKAEARPSSKPSHWCQLCSKLNDPGEKPKVYEDIHRWWVEGGQCKSALDLPAMDESSVVRYFNYYLDILWMKLRDGYHYYSQKIVYTFK